MNLVSATGPPSEIMIVGDYPTDEEYQQGSAFIGSIHRFTNSLLIPNKWKLTKSYCTYYVKMPIPGFRSKIQKVRTHALAEVYKLENWKEILREEIKAVQPNAILGFGELALNVLTGEKSIHKFRGSILPIHHSLSDKPTNVMCCLSARNVWEMNEVPFAYTQWDVGKLIAIKDLKTLFKPKELIWIVRNPAEFSNWWQRASSGRFLTLDIETHYGFITCISFCHDGYEAISVPLLIGQGMDGHSRGILYQHLDRVLKHSIPKVNQNISYDLTVLQRWGMNISNIVGDTMLMQQTIYPELPKGLDFLTSIYTDQPYYKDEGKNFDPKIHSADQLLNYNARDSLTAWQIWDKQQADAQEMGVKYFFFRNVIPAFFIFKKISERGIRVDDLERRKLIQKYEPLFNENKTIINLIAGEQINPLSPKQVGRFVYEILKCPKHTHTTDAGRTEYDTGEEVIEEIYINEITDNGIKEILKRLIFARKLGKVLQFLNCPISPDERMRASFRLQWAKTGRNTASKGLEKSYALNKRGKIEEIELGNSFQTIPKHGFKFGKESFGKDLRRIFIPSPGYVFIEGDLAQAEDRVVCVLAEDWEGMEILNKKTFKYNKNGFKDDRHVQTAILITGKSFEAIEYDDRQYLGKAPRHAGNYDAGAGVLSVMTHFPRPKCQEILNRFHEISPKIRGIFHAQIREQINKYRYLRSPNGRRRDFFGRIIDEMYKQAFSQIPQSVVSDHNKFTILQGMIKEFPEPVAYPVCESHDSLTWEVLSDAKDGFIEAYDRVTKTSINFKECSLSREYELVIPGEFAYSEFNWGEMHTWKT